MQEKERLTAHFATIEALRSFFRQRDFLETPTPPMVPNPGMEAHLHAFKVEGQHLRDQYLHTSPEFAMKKLLSLGFEKIYHLGYCFRDEPRSSTHRPQFLMLEWYRAHAYYHTILQDTLELISFCSESLKEKGFSTQKWEAVEHVTVNELFEQYLHFSILDFLDTSELKKKIEKDFPQLHASHENLWPWEDYFFLLFLNKIEPHFPKNKIFVVDEFPAPLSALSTLKKDNPLVAERFEIYLDGVELCNCFNELTDLKNQRERMQLEKAKKRTLYGVEYPEPIVLYDALEKGLPSSAGIALGVERLTLGIVKYLPHPFFS